MTNAGPTKVTTAVCGASATPALLREETGILAVDHVDVMQFRISIVFLQRISQVIYYTFGNIPYPNKEKHPSDSVCAFARNTLGFDPQKIYH